MIETIDARGLACPQPTVLTKALIERGQLNFEIIVDSDVAKENIERIAKRMGYKVAETRSGMDISLRLVKEADIEEKSEFSMEKPKSMEKIVCTPKNVSVTAIVLNSDYIGENDELGMVLMKGFLYSLVEVNPEPNAVILMHNAVKMAVSGSGHLENLELLIKRGIKIYTCGPCLDYYSLKEKASLGTIVNMHDIVELLLNSDRVVSI